MHVTRAMVRRAELAVAQYKDGKFTLGSPLEAQIFLRHVLRAALQDVPKDWDENTVEYKEQIDRLTARLSLAKKTLHRARDYIRRHPALEHQALLRILHLKLDED